MIPDFVNEVAFEQRRIILVPESLVDGMLIQQVYAGMFAGNSNNESLFNALYYLEILDFDSLYFAVESDAKLLIDFRRLWQFGFLLLELLEKVGHLSLLKRYSLDHDYSTHWRAWPFMKKSALPISQNMI